MSEFSIGTMYSQKNNKDRKIQINETKKVKCFVEEVNFYCEEEKYFIS